MNERGRRGSVLTMVLWVMGLLGTIALYLFYRAELELAAVAGWERDCRMRQMGEEVLRERLSLLVNDDMKADDPNDAWYGHGLLEEERDGCRIFVMASDEGTKPNLNFLNEASLKILCGVKSDGQFDALFDWLDPDDEARFFGAESLYYLALKKPYKPRNGFISSLAELKQVKNGEDYYKALAPHVTVYGRVNPNTIPLDNFSWLLTSIGVDDFFVERIGRSFREYRLGRNPEGGPNRFDTYDDFLKLDGLTIAVRDKLKPFFQFQGNCNINFANEQQLAEALLRAVGSTEMVGEIIARRQEKFFTDQQDLEAFFRVKHPHLRTRDFFVTVSTVIRLRIWIERGDRVYFLETVQERFPDQGQDRWRVRTLYRRALWDDEAPPVPENETEEAPGSEAGT